LPSSQQHHQREKGDDNYSCCHLLYNNSTKGLRWSFFPSYQVEGKGEGNDNYYRLLCNNTPTEKDDNKLLLSSSFQTKRREGKGNNSYHRLLRSNTPTQEDDDNLLLSSSFQIKIREE
jgi:hypothetical protein